jgi:hypothetical protein
MKQKIAKIIDWFKALPTKKNHVEFITAVLSVPVMLTVIILNLNNLNQQKNATQKQQSTSTPAPIQVIITGDKPMKQPPASADLTQPIAPTASYISPTAQSCIREVGPVSIVSPREDEVVTVDPVCITLATQSNYCTIKWSYQINGGNWSDYTDQNICIHNLTNGNKTVQLKIRSAVSDDAITLQRTFVYQGNSVPTANPTVASSSANL